MATRPAGWVTHRNRFSGVQGMTKLRRILFRAPKDAGDIIKDEVKEFARKVEMTASQSARGGSMASARYAQSISTKISRAGYSADVGIVTAAGRKKAWFGHFIEWGTKAGTRQWKGKTKRVMRRRTGSFFHPGTPARPVLFPAFERHRHEVAPKINKAIDAVLAKLAAGPDD